eukprot:CAMPEP_0203883740 /NCGR_PEP_ID=MMETSP0359-20131031/27819_1 /ASSEMBLY_ACC=CAM_ASM_000338 /TAXON_ID=268821 /ORGANISM="Scrippsiella Hangoei, Strain SHTV-5" /LENGTH=37 /DNA_ID= /DNA_START= /DNA_END= /DNA_ORIENTATION=
MNYTSEKEDDKRDFDSVCSGRLHKDASVEGTLTMEPP